VRFSLAREAGFTEEEVQLIDGNWESSPFPPEWTAALSFTDHFILTPGPLPLELRNSLFRYFTNAQLSELAIGIGLFHGFSKMLIGLGREPEEMDTTIVPTPTMPESPAPNVHSGSDEFFHLFKYIPAIKQRWQLLEKSVWDMDELPESILSLIKKRTAIALGGLHQSPQRETISPSPDGYALEITNSFMFNIRGITSDERAAIVDRYGTNGLLQMFLALALYDGIFRIKATELVTDPPSM